MGATRDDVHPGTLGQDDALVRPSADVFQLAWQSGGDDDHARSGGVRALERQGVSGGQCQWRIPGLGGDEGPGLLPAQVEDGGGEAQLLGVEVVEPSGADLVEHVGEPVEVDLTAVVGVDEGGPGDLRPLVDVCDPRDGELQGLRDEDRRTLRGSGQARPLLHEGPHPGVTEASRREVEQVPFPIEVGCGPGGPRLLLAHGLEQVLAQSGGGHRVPVGPRPRQRLPQEVLGAPVQACGSVGGGDETQLLDERRPFGRVGRQGRESRTHVLAPLRVVGRPCGHRGGPGGLEVGLEGVEGIGIDAEASRCPADLGQGRQVGPPVVRGVLDPLGHDGAAHLLEAHGDLVAPVVGGGQPRGAHLLAEDQCREHVHRVTEVLVESFHGATCGVRDDVAGGLGCRGVGDDVGTVAVHLDEECAQAVDEPAQRVVPQPEVLLAHVPHEGRHAAHLRGERGVDDIGLRGADEVVEGGGGVAGDLLHDGAQGHGRPGVHLDRVDAPGGVVACGARHVPVPGQGLVLVEDLLGRDPGAARALGEAFEVSARVGQAVGVVDPEGIDESLPEEFQEERMGGVEDLGALDPDARQGTHVEETAVVEFLVPDLPVGQPVGLALQEDRHRQRLGALEHGEDVVVVAQDPLLAVLSLGGDHHPCELQAAVGQHLADAGVEDGHEDLLVADDVEPAGVGGVLAVFEDGPQRLVLPHRSGHGHVVGHDVDDDVQTGLMGRAGKGLEGAAPPEVGSDVCVVDDVVAVARTGDGLEDRGEVDIGDAQGHEVGEDRPGVVEGEVGCQLESVGGHGDAPAHVGQVGMGIWHARPLTRPGG